MASMTEMVTASMMEMVTTSMTILNGTDVGKPPPQPHYFHELQLTNQIVLTVTLVVIMIALGCTIEVHDIKTTLRRPTGVLVGFVAQFVIMPLLAFALAHALQIQPAFAIGMLVTGCSPGGAMSNIFCYWAEGDVCLSVLMTTASTLVAFGMMPLNLFIYSRSWTDEKTAIPFGAIVLVLITILIPVILGILIRNKLKKMVPYILKLGSMCGILGLCVAIVLGILLNPKAFTSGWKVWFAAATLPLFGYGFGYALSWILRQSHKKCRTIAFETGFQNVPLALTLIAVTFAGSPQVLDILTYPALFGMFTLVDATVCVIIYKIVSRFRKQVDTKLSTDQENALQSDYIKV